MGDSEQQLFLAEFLVDKVNVPSIRAMHTEMLPVTTCVSFQILSLPPINIYQDTTPENCTCLDGDTQIFKKGKSCLFALPTTVLEKPLQSFPINMSVYKKLPPGVLPDVMLIGCHQIEAKDLINSMLNRHVFKTGKPSKTLKDSFKLKTATGQRVGEVTVFIRISCFGEKIVTQFQMPQNKEPYLFKGTNNSPVFQCKRIPSNLEERGSAAGPRCVCEPMKLRSMNAENGEKKNERPCCLRSIPPPCPPPTRQLSSRDSSPRPCCPSNRGDQCPSCSQSPEKYSSNLHRAEPKNRREEKGRSRKCGCSPSEQENENDR